MRIVVYIILSIFSFALFGVVFLSSYFVDAKYKQVPNIEKTLTGIEYFSEKQFSQNIISTFDSLYSTSTGFTVEEDTQGLLKIGLTGTGKYMSSFYNVGKQYIISGEYFSLKQQGIGEVYIDSSKENKIFIFSLNSSAEVSLTNNDNSETYTNVVLYPRMYIEIDTRRNRGLSGADKLRVSTILPIGYIGKTTSDSTDTSSKIGSYIGDPEGFYKTTLKFIQQNHKNLRENISDIKSLFTTSDEISQIATNYVNLFVNEEKKKVLLKNSILYELSSILHSTEENTITTSNITQQLGKLKILSKQEYEEMNELIKNISFAHNTDYEGENAQSKILLANIYSEDIDDTNLFHLYGYSLYTGYEHAANIENNYFTRYLESFRKYIGVSLQSMSTVKTGYFAFFLEKNIEYILKNTTSAEQSLPIINDIISFHTSIWPVTYDDTIINRISGIYIYSEVLENLSAYIRKVFFETERSDDGLLVVVQNNTSLTNIATLNREVLKIFDIFKQNEKFLDTDDLRDATILSEYTQNKKDIEEYLLALIDYDLYGTNYDTAKNTIINIDTVNSSDEKERTFDEAVEYLLYFQGLDFSYATVDVIDNTYFTINNLIIGGKSFTFDLYPEDNYVMKNIVIDNSEFGSQYTLGNYVFEDLETPDDESKLFFINTFFSVSDSSDIIEEFTFDGGTNNEDRAEIVFKRDRLLGSEFKNILDVLAIEYENIKLLRNNETYDIFIEDVPKSIGGNSAIFSSQYYFSDIDHDFGNIQLDFEFGTLSVPGKTNISDIENLFRELATEIDSVGEVSEQVLISYEISSVDISYLPLNRKWVITFDIDDETYTIAMQDGIVNGFFRGSSRLLTQPQEVIQFIQSLP